jgi:hypothetical protein
MQGIAWIKIHTIHHNSYQVLLIHMAKQKALQNDFLFYNFAVAPEAK